ncbi:response regulator transcription factor, partial [Pseudomonas viridiflava]
DIHDNLVEYFELRGHNVQSALDGLTGLHLAATQTFDAILLDIMLPGIDGNQICRSLRQYSKIDVAILMLSARDELEDRLLGFSVGTDDYITKPFALSEVLARVEAVVARRQKNNRVMVVADLEFDLDTWEVSRRGKP